MQKRFGVYTNEGNFDLLGDKYVYYTKYVDIGRIYQNTEKTYIKP